jgi:hypothetical protein
VVIGSAVSASSTPMSGDDVADLAVDTADPLLALEGQLKPGIAVQSPPRWRGQARAGLDVDQTQQGPPRSLTALAWSPTGGRRA